MSQILMLTLIFCRDSYRRVRSIELVRKMSTQEWNCLAPGYPRPHETSS